MTPTSCTCSPRGVPTVRANRKTAPSATSSMPTAMLTACRWPCPGRDRLPESVNLFMGVPSSDPDVLAGGPPVYRKRKLRPCCAAAAALPHLHLLGPEQPLDSTPLARAGHSGQQPHYLDHEGFDTL